MPKVRQYGDGCAIAVALDTVGERWALLVVRELLLGPKRFTDLQAGLPRAGAKVLSQRLRELESAGVVQRRILSPPAASTVYELTERGAALQDVIAALGLWGTSVAESSSDPIGADSAVLRLRTYFVPQPGQPWSATYEIRLGRDRFAASVVGGALVVLSRGESRERPDAVIDTDPGTLNAALASERERRAATKDGRLTIAGDDRAVRRLFAAVRVPSAAGFGR